VPQGPSEWPAFCSADLGRLPSGRTGLVLSFAPLRRERMRYIRQFLCRLFLTIATVIPANTATANLFDDNDYQSLYTVGQRITALEKEIFQVYEALGQQQQFHGTDCLDPCLSG
jgi:hypothetical protein